MKTYFILPHKHQQSNGNGVIHDEIKDVSFPENQVLDGQNVTLPSISVTVIDEDSSDANYSDSSSSTNNDIQQESLRNMQFSENHIAHGDRSSENHTGR